MHDTCVAGKGLELPSLDPKLPSIGLGFKGSSLNEAPFLGPELSTARL